MRRIRYPYHDQVHGESLQEMWRSLDCTGLIAEIQKQRDAVLVRCGELVGV